MTETFKNRLMHLYETEIQEVKGVILNNKFLIYNAKDEREEYMYAQNEMEFESILRYLRN